MKVLFTTNDKSKKDFYKHGFQMASSDVEFLDANNPEIKDKVKFEVKMDMPDTNCIEKSNNIYDEDLVTVSISESLFIDGLDDNMQPGANFKTPKVLKENMSDNSKISDMDLINYYAGVVEKLGGEASAKVVDDVTISYKGKVIKEFKVENPKVFTSRISKVITKGNPLNSITLVPEFGDIHVSECGEMEEELLYETRDKKALKTIAKEIEDVTKNIINNSYKEINYDNVKYDNVNLSNGNSLDFLHNEVSSK